MTAPHDFALLGRLDAEATAVPWSREWNNQEDPDNGIDIMGRGEGGRVALVEHSEFGTPFVRNAELIVAARNALPASLACVRALARAMEKLHQIQGHWKADDEPQLAALSAFTNIIETEA